MCLTRMEELESCLSGLLSTLKKNREHVPLEVLKTQYKQPYEELVRNINLTLLPMQNLCCSTGWS